MIAPGPIPPDVQKAIDQFHTEADKIIQPFVEGLKAKKPPPLIYHYTGDVGLRGILETGQLRLTDVFSLNGTAGSAESMERCHPACRLNGGSGERCGLNGANSRHGSARDDTERHQGELELWNRIVGFEQGQYLASRLKDFPAPE